MHQPLSVATPGSSSSLMSLATRPQAGYMLLPSATALQSNTKTTQRRQQAARKQIKRRNKGSTGFATGTMVFVTLGLVTCLKGSVSLDMSILEGGLGRAGSIQWPLSNVIFMGGRLCAFVVMWANSGSKFVSEKERRKERTWFASHNNACWDKT